MARKAYLSSDRNMKFVGVGITAPVNGVYSRDYGRLHSLGNMAQCCSQEKVGPSLLPKKPRKKLVMRESTMKENRRVEGLTRLALNLEVSGENDVK